MSRVLAVYAKPPFPPDHALRTPQWQYLTAVADICDVTILTWQPPDVPDAHLDALRSVASELLILPWLGRSNTLASRVRRRVRFVAGADPHYVQALAEERGVNRAEGATRMRREIERRHAADPYDLIILGEDALARFSLPPLDGVPVLVHRWNSFSSIVDGLERATGHGVRRRLEARGWRRFEAAVTAAADLVVTPTPEVALEVNRIAPATRTACVTNGVSRDRLATPPSRGGDVAFIGAMDYAANIDAVEWFARECWPALRTRFPESTFRVIGREAGERLRALDGNGIRIVGAVDSLEAASEGTRVGVVPLRAGMGIKNKTLELMAMGVPVVTLPSGSEGIAASAEDGLITVETADAFVAAVADLLDDPARADRLGSAASSYVRRHHSWEEARNRYRRHVEGLINAQRANLVP